MHENERIFLEHRRKLALRPDWERFMKPVHPDEHKARPAPSGEQAARMQVADEGITEADWLELRAMFVDLKLDFQLACLRRKYSPDQPRVPAGLREGGQWTHDAGGTLAGDRNAGRNDPRVISDATPDNTAILGAQYAQGDRLQGYPVDLREEEARGGHTIQRHVNRSPEALIAQAQEAFDRDPRAQDVRSGSFSSLEAATRLVNSTLAQNRFIVSQVANGVVSVDVVKAEFDSVTGLEAVVSNMRSQPYFQETYGVGAVIVHNRFSPHGFTVWTAFPRNR